MTGIDPARCHDEDCAPILRALIDDIIRRQGPVRADRLWRAVAQARCWQRTGRLI